MLRLATNDPTAVVILIGGVAVTPFARVGQVRIDDLINDTPNTAALTLVAEPRHGPPTSGAFPADAFDPGAFATAGDPAPVLLPPPMPIGASIAIYVGAVDPALQVFGGQITTRAQTAVFGVPAHVRYDITAIDHTRRLNARIVSKDYPEASATAIVVDLIATFAPAITTHHVMADLATIDGGIAFTWEETSRALSRIAEKIGAYWYIDYAGDLHFWTGTEAGTDPAPLVPGGKFADLKVSADLTQVRTRVYVEGEGGTVALTLPAGDAIVPLDTTTVFNDAGGLAVIGPTRVAYSGKNPGGVKTNTVGVGGITPNAPTAPSAAVASAAGALAGGPYRYAVTFELADGSRSPLGAASAAVTIPGAVSPPPTNAALPTPPISGPIKAGETATYATTFVDATGNETDAPGGGNVLTGRAIDNPSVAILGRTSTGGGNVDPGFHFYACSYLTATGETGAVIQPGAINTGAGGAVNLVLQGGNPFPDPRIQAVRIYRSTTSQSSTGPLLPWRVVYEWPKTGGPGVYADVSPDSALATANLPGRSTADGNGEGAVVTVPTSADARIVGRRVYRKDDGGEYRLVADIRDNTTGTYTDTLPAAGSNLAPKTNRINSGAVNVTNIPIGPTGTVRRRLFRTAAGGSDFREVTAIADNVATAYLDALADTGLGGSPLAGAGPGGGTLLPTPTGATEVAVEDSSKFPAAGWLSAESLTAFRYTGVAAGKFTGVPASGVGAITADIPAGAVITSIPALVGVAPVFPVTLGDTVQLVAQVDDLAAQAALAAIDGSDGVIERYVQDRRLSEASARARGLAELELFKSVELQLSYTTHDPNTRSGRLVHVDLPAPTNLVGDFLIQKVTIADVSIARNFYPKRSVEASTTRFSFDDVLARILIEQR